MHVSNGNLPHQRVGPAPCIARLPCTDRLQAALKVYNSDAGNPLPSFGKKLKLEREKRAITLEQISNSTKIGTRMLRALEEEDFDQLPGGIFNKGFVRAYARHVGLDEDQAAERAVTAVEKLRNDIGVPRRLRDLGLKETQLRGLAEMSYTIRRIIRVNPRPVTVADLEGILQSAF